MLRNFPSKNVLITGSTSGIGFAIAKKFYQQGYQVVINGRDPDRLQHAADQLPGVISVLADVTNPVEANSMVNRILENFGSLNLLVCNVGGGNSVPPGSENSNEWGRMFDLNFRSATNVIESAKTASAETEGSIVCISSICGSEVIDNAPLTYSVAKAALNAYIRGAARPFAKLGVRINAVAPGNIFFQDSVWDSKLKKDADQVLAYISDVVPLNCFGTPDDVAELVFYLSSEKSKFVTGSIWRLDGGQGHL